MDLNTLLGAWKSVEIVRSFLRAVTSRWGAASAKGAVVEVPGPAELKDAYFGERVYIGQRVRVTGRLSRHCPVYFPIAYSPQAQFNPSPNSWVSAYNPAPTAMMARVGSGEAMGFLFETAATETPRIISQFHPDRTQMIPFHLADPSIPVLVDVQSEQYFEELVTIEGVLTTLDPLVSAAIASSHEDVVKLYYHTFYKADFYPTQGFVIDARGPAGGRVAATHQAAPFETTIGIEAKYRASLAPEDVEAAIQSAFAQVVGWSGPARYQPAYYTPPGYRIVQFSEGGLIVHVAPELGVINFGTVIDTLNPDRDRISKLLLPGARAVVQAIRSADSTATFDGLFASNPDFHRQIGVRG